MSPVDPDLESPTPVGPSDSNPQPDAEQPGAESNSAEHRQAARAVLDDIGLTEVDLPQLRPDARNRTSIVLPCDGPGGQQFLLKYFVPPEEGRFYPAGVRLTDYPRREAAFYRYLDTVDPERLTLPAPKTVVIDGGDPPRWILLERIASAVGPAEEVLDQNHVFELLQSVANLQRENLLGRRNFPLNRWDSVSYLERVRLMYDPVLFVIGEQRWTRSQEFFTEALRWNESRQQGVVHGDFTEQNVLIDEDGNPYLLDFERIGIGNIDHDFAWFWIHSERNPDWKRELFYRYVRDKVGSDRIRTEWGIRSAVVYLALRRLRFGYLMFGADDENIATNLALLDAALAGGGDLFPF